MPEVISKYPEITIKVLKEAGLRCGEGVPQRILTNCPPKRFCQAPTGEVCVYGLNEISQMTQISRSEIVSDFQKLPENLISKTEAPEFNILYLLAAVLVFIIGFYLGSLRKPSHKNLQTTNSKNS